MDLKIKINNRQKKAVKELSLRSVNLYGLTMIALLAIFVLAGTGCANKKKLSKTETVEVKDNRIAVAKDKLLKIINDDGSIPLAEKERTLNEIIDMNLDDPEINRLIAQAQDKIEREKKALNEAATPVQNPDVAPVETIESYHTKLLQGLFTDIAASAGYDQARNKMDEALKLFASPEAPVLIAIIEQDGMVDYDRPTSIKKYLEFLMDQKKSLNEIRDIKYDGNGKIIELELIKK